MKCDGRAISGTGVGPVVQTADHNHLEDVVREIILKANVKAKERGADTKENPRTIIKASKTKLDRFEAAKKTRKHNLCQAISRIRRNQPHRQPNPVRLSVLNLPKQLRVTFHGRKFYYER